MTTVKEYFSEKGLDIRGKFFVIRGNVFIIAQVSPGACRSIILSKDAHNRCGELFQKTDCDLFSLKDLESIFSSELITHRLTTDDIQIIDDIEELASIWKNRQNYVFSSKFQY